MKVQTPKVDLWLVTLVMACATVATAQVSPALGNLDAPAVLASNSSEIESSSTVTAEASLPDAPSAIAKERPPDEPVTPPAQQPRPPVPGTDAPIGKTFWGANLALMGSTIANAEMITRCRPTSCLSVPDSIRTRVALYGIGIPATVGVTYISYRLKRSGTKMWIVPVALLTAGNIAYAWHAAQWSH